MVLEESLDAELAFAEVAADEAAVPFETAGTLALDKAAFWDDPLVQGMSIGE